MRGTARLSLACLLLSGCMLGPNYKGPPKMLPQGQNFVRAADAGAVPSPPLAQWWLALHDAELNQLEAQALAASPDLAAARARLRESRAQLHADQAQLLPTTGASGVYLHSHSGDGLLNGLVGGASGSGTQDLNFYSTGFDASWELDLFGAKRRTAEGAAAQAQARIADLADTQVSLTANVARAYVDLRADQQRAALAEASLGLHQQMLALEQQRAAAGTVSQDDLVQLAQQVQQDQANLAPLRAEISVQLDQLAILTGQLPGALDAALAAPTPVPMPPAQVAVGDPALLLRQRPDIRSAERNIAARNAAIGQHLADYFPKVTLLGDIGFSSTNISQLFNGNAFSVLAAPMISWTPFDFGRTEAAVSQARAGRDEAVAKYQSTVLKALQDAEDSLARYGAQRQNLQALAQAYGLAQRSAGFARQRAAQGTISHLQMLSAQRDLDSARDRFIQAQARTTEDYIALQKSLGLGWQAPGQG